MTLGIEYRGHTITYSELFNKWEVMNDRSYPSLTDAKTRVDSIEKNNSPFKGKTVIRFAKWDHTGPEKVTITSVTVDGDVWVVNEKNTRSKVDAKDAHLLCEPDESLLARYAESIAKKNAAYDAHKLEYAQLLKDAKPLFPKETQ